MDTAVVPSPFAASVAPEVIVFLAAALEYAALGITDSPRHFPNKFEISFGMSRLVSGRVRVRIRI
jgi:hypothetical protein